MKCGFCGNEVEEGMKYCPFCGAEIKKESQTEEPEKKEEDLLKDPNEHHCDQSADKQGDQQGQAEGQQNYQYGQNGQNGNGGAYQYGQPGNGSYGQPPKRISGTPYLVFSILVTLCCCLPFGIVGIVYASKINSLQNAGDYAGAEKAAKRAKVWIIVGAVCGLLSSVLVGTFSFFDDASSIQSRYEEFLTDDQTEEDDAEEVKVTEKSVTANQELGESWDSYTVQINGKVLAFPCAFDEVKEAGLTLDTDDKSEDYVLDQGEYEWAFFEDENYHSLIFLITNLTDEIKELRDCTISGVCVDEYDVADGELEVVFPGNIQIGADIDEVLKLWGEASDVYEGEYSHSYTWYGDRYNYCSVSADPDTGKVTGIDLDGQEAK